MSQHANRLDALPFKATTGLVADGAAVLTDLGRSDDAGMIFFPNAPTKGGVFRGCGAPHPTRSRLLAVLSKEPRT